MLGKDLKKLFEKIPDNARVMVKMQGYGDQCRDIEEKDINFKFSELELVEIEDHYSPNNEAFTMNIPKKEIDNENNRQWLKSIKILSTFKAVVLKKSVKP